ncbi:VPLPA-CTERM sorting domain-containing protein [Hyphococcus sp.]|uniref:VPLPA-CTERM sorting domain-containing protein n=1 Tax=Hyphococcus sp. TaxID=2038636 RepID=UPI003CCC0D6F
MKIIIGGISIAVLAATALPAQAAVVYTDRSAFEAALSGSVVTDDFDNDIATADSITFDSGVVATKSSSGVPPTLNRVSNGDYDGFVQRDDFRNITFDFPQSVSAFGADFSELSSLFINGDFDGTGETQFSISDIVGSDAGFFGIIGEADFSSVFFTTLAGTVLTPGAAPFGGETFSLDNLTLAGGVNAEVPVPAALPLLLTGLGALGFAGRRKKKAAAAKA